MKSLPTRKPINTQSSMMFSRLNLNGSFNCNMCVVFMIHRTAGSKDKTHDNTIYAKKDTFSRNSVFTNTKSVCISVYGVK